MKSKSTLIFITFIIIFSHLIHAENQTKKLIKDLKSVDPEKQYQAKTQLRTYRFKEIADSMTDYANDSNPDIRILMVQTLGELGGFESAASLKKLYFKEKDPKVRRAIIVQLAGLIPDDQEALDFFKKSALKDKDPDLRFLALSQLSFLNAIEHKNELINIFNKVFSKDDSQQNKIYCAILLKELGKESSNFLPLLIEGLKNELPEIKKRAVFQLGPIWKKEPDHLFSKYPIQELAQDKDLDVRANLCRALGESEKNEIIPLLQTLTSDPEIIVRKSALTALTSFFDKIELQIYIHALKDSDTSIRSLVIGILEQHGTTQSIKPLEILAQSDPEPEIRTLAKKALATLSSLKNKRENK